MLTGQPPLEKVVALNEQLVLRPRSESQEKSAHVALLDCAQSFSPEVEDTSPGAVLLNLAGIEPLLGPLPKIARDLAQRIRG